MGRIVSIHEYDLRPGVDTDQFEHALRDAEARGLLRLPGLVTHHFIKGIKGGRRGAYAAVWVYESREAWERLWGTLAHPRSPQEYPDTWKIWEGECLAPFLRTHPDAIRFTTYEELNEWAYRFYLRRGPAAAGPPVVATFGCFAYSVLSGDRVRLHFQNTDPSGHSPLAAARRAERIAELTALFGDLARTASGAVRVVGASWLYNLEGYRRLFPASYVATARVMSGRFQRMPLWGQFVDRHGDIRPGPAAHLRERLARQSSLEGLDRCFPFQVLTVEAPARDFYERYGV
jgi:hypothetical protein